MASWEPVSWLADQPGTSILPLLLLLKACPVGLACSSRMQVWNLWSLIDSFIEVEFTCYKVHAWEGYNAAVFSVFTELYSHHALTLEHFHRPRKDPLRMSSRSPFPPTPGSWQPLIHFLQICLFQMFQMNGIMYGLFMTAHFLIWRKMDAVSTLLIQNIPFPCVDMKL